MPFATSTEAANKSVFATDALELDGAELPVDLYDPGGRRSELAADAPCDTYALTKWMMKKGIEANRVPTRDGSDAALFRRRAFAVAALSPRSNPPSSTGHRDNSAL